MSRWQWGSPVSESERSEEHNLASLVHEKTDLGLCCDCPVAFSVWSLAFSLSVDYHISQYPVSQPLLCAYFLPYRSLREVSSCSKCFRPSRLDLK